ncbi:MAG: hypothetical protein ABIT10_09860 [Alteraurantiacibacter sp.]
MFEAKLTTPPAEPGPQASSADSDSLRELSWSDLRARLNAARDLRVSLARGLAQDLASFDAPAARHVAALANGKDAVNPTDLANRKGTGSITLASHDASDGRP